MKKNTLRLMIAGCAVYVLLLMLPSHAQDTWPGRCQLPDLEEALSAASDAQVDGDVVAYVNSLSEINQLVDAALQDCLEAAIRDDANLTEADLSNANLAQAILRGADLQESLIAGANLQGAKLSGANLQGANLHSINLKGAQLTDANLQDTWLNDANLQGANLSGANLQNAWLSVCICGEPPANLQAANLSGANLSGANLEGTTLTDALLDENTILPDGTNWTPDTDIARFTDPMHPEFWEHPE